MRALLVVCFLLLSSCAERSPLAFEYKVKLSPTAAGQRAQQERENRRADAVRLNDLGEVEGRNGNLNQAFSLFDKAAVRDATYYRSFSNMGLLLAFARDWKQSSEMLKRSILLNATDSQAWNNLANVLKQTDDPDDATANMLLVRMYTLALRLHPDSVDSLSNLAGAYNRLTMSEHALRFSLRCLKLDRTVEEVQAIAVIAAAHCVYWGPELSFVNADMVVQREIEKLQRDGSAEAGMSAGFAVMYCDIDGSLIRTLAEHEERRNAALANVPLPFGTAAWSDEQSRMKLAYLGRDFNAHPMAMMMQGLFRDHNRNHFSILCYSSQPSDNSQVRTKIERSCDEFADISHLSDTDAAAAINSRTPHVLVTLYGFIQGHRNGITARRPAPLIVHHRWCSTTGAPWVNHFVTDRVAVPPEFSSWLTEALLVLPDSYLPNDHASSYPLPPSAQQWGTAPFSDIIRDLQDLKQSSATVAFQNWLHAHAAVGAGLLLSSINNTPKITPAVWALWMQILNARHNATVLVVADSAKLRRLQTAAISHGVSPSRVVSASSIEKLAHIFRNAASHLFLDTWLLSAHSTAVDALWAGLPVIIAGWNARMGARVAASVAVAANCAFLIARTPDDYKAIAHALLDSTSGNQFVRSKLPPKLRLWREMVWGNRSSNLFDAARFARNIDRGYRLAWDVAASRGHSELRRPHIIVHGPYEEASAPWRGKS
jgi:protein O-GlcNAc transferase